MQRRPQFISAARPERIFSKWARIRWPAESAESSDSSPARTAPATIVASSRALEPGSFGAAPATPSISRQARCGRKIVPPPTVPTSIDGIVHETCKSTPPLVGSRSRAVTILEAWALKPPSAPAMAEPIRFLATLSSQAAATVVLRTRSTTSPLIVASTTTE
eukprot:scaffold231562_cov28-Tisochrysis_lutea.AAC.1